MTVDSWMCELTTEHVVLDPGQTERTTDAPPLQVIPPDAVATNYETERHLQSTYIYSNGEGDDIGSSYKTMENLHQLPSVIVNRSPRQAPWKACC